MTPDTVPFGKYKGRPVEDMLADADYMAWLEAQPWFRERFKHLVARRDEDAASRTPVHNRLQSLFLDTAYCYAFARVAEPGMMRECAENGRKAALRVRDRVVDFIKAAEAQRPSTYDGANLKRLSAAKEHLSAIDRVPLRFTLGRSFEVAGCDVAVSVAFKGPGLSDGSWSYSASASVTVYDAEDLAQLPVLRIEIKPSVADEFPAVLRQMARNRSAYLFLSEYGGEGVSESDFVAMFAASGKRVVFKRDVDAEFAQLKAQAE